MTEQQMHENQEMARTLTHWLQGTADALPASPSGRDRLLAGVAETPQRSHRWLPPIFTGRFQSMFSATKFVVAGAIVALFGGFLLAGVLTQPSEESVPAGATGGPGTFSLAGSLAEVHEGHTATLLSDSRVLVVGGSSAEVWDPATASFSPAGSLAAARSAHAATLLPDGRVLVVGGWDDGGPLASAEVWDPATASFGPAGSLAEGRSGHTATLLPDGRVLVIGGERVDGHVASAEVWDPAVGRFVPVGSLTFERALHTATLLPDGRVLVVGGWEGSDVGRRIPAEVWDPTTTSFDLAGTPTEGRWHHTATLLPDGNVLILGGSGPKAWNEGPYPSPEVWDPGTATFSPAASLAENRGAHTATLLPDGRVLAVGGSLHDVFASTEVWDPATASFGPAGSPADARAGHTATLLSDGRVLVVGGWPNNGELLASAEVWIASEETELAPDPPPSIESPDPEQTTTDSDLLPGVDLVTEEVAPGVLHVISDGERTLSIPVSRTDSDLDHGRFRTASKIVVAPDGSIWVFGPQEFFRVGEKTAHAGMRWSEVDVDADGTVWALLEPGDDDYDGYGDYRHKNLSTFDGERWLRKARQVVDFELHPDGETFIVVDSNDGSSGPGLQASIGPVHDGAWEDVGVVEPWKWGGMPSGGEGYGGFAISPLATPSNLYPRYIGWAVDGRGLLHDIEFDPSGEGGGGGCCSTEGSVVGLGYGSDGTSWVHLRFDLPLMTGGELTTESAYFLAQYDASDQESPGATYESAVSRPQDFDRDLPAPHLDVAPDGSVWLPSDDGLARFDGRMWMWFLRGNIIEDVDIASDGTVWVQANDLVIGPQMPPVSEQDPTTKTYAITAEAVAATE